MFAYYLCSHLHYACSSSLSYINSMISKLCYYMASQFMLLGFQRIIVQESLLLCFLFFPPLFHFLFLLFMVAHHLLDLWWLPCFCWVLLSLCSLSCFCNISIIVRPFSILHSLSAIASPSTPSNLYKILHYLTVSIITYGFFIPSLIELPFKLYLNILVN